MLQPAHFTVQTVDAGIGEVLVYIEDPEGHTEEVWRGHWGSDKSADQQRNGLAMAAGAPSNAGEGEASPWGLQKAWGQKEL